MACRVLWQTQYRSREQARPGENSRQEQNYYSDRLLEFIFHLRSLNKKKSPHAQSLSCMNPWYITLFAFINHIFLHSRLINHPGHCSTCSSCWSLETSFTNSFCAKSQHTSHHFLIMHRQPFMYRYISYRTIAMTSSYPEYSRANRTLSI